MNLPNPTRSRTSSQKVVNARDQPRPSIVKILRSGESFSTYVSRFLWIYFSCPVSFDVSDPYAPISSGFVRRNPDAKSVSKSDALTPAKIMVGNWIVLTRPGAFGP
jgi:hypothetical protein